VAIRTYSSAAGTTTGLQYVEGQHNPPAKQVVLRCAHNPSPSSSAAADATAADATRWTQEWVEVPSAVDDEIAAAWGSSAKVATVETALTFSADAAAELPAWVAELSAPPTLYELPALDGAPGVWIGHTDSAFHCYRYGGLFQVIEDFSQKYLNDLHSAATISLGEVTT
jgi:hypothetical protein